MIDNNIIQSLGAGSGIDTKNIVKQLTEIERSAPQERIDSKRVAAETKISDFGLLSNALATLQESADALVKPEGLFSKTASFTDSDALAPTKLSTEVQPGIYNFEVAQTAQSQALAFDEYASTTAAVGEGTLSFSFGNWTRDGDNNLDSFNADADRDPVEVTITSENNSLEGLKDAINDADMGVTASIVHTGTGYKLSILAASGSNNELQIAATENGTAGLNNFKFDATVPALETQLGQDALISINGLQVARDSNTITDIVDGLTLDLYKAAPGETITITVLDDKEFAEQNIRDFVAAYNSFLEEVDPIFGVREEEDEEGNKETVIGSLANDSLAKSVLSGIRGTIASAIPGLADANFTSLTNIGIRTELDGTLGIDEKDFTSAMEQRFEDVQKLFSPQTHVDGAGVRVNSFSDNTVAGTYEIEITTPPAKGYLNGGDITNATGVSEFPVLDPGPKDYTFKINVNGTESDTITVPSTAYANEGALAEAIQLAVDADANLAATNATLSVVYDGDNNRFRFTSSEYGTSSNVSITEASDDIAADLGMGVAVGTAGVAVAGTVNGVEGFGSANVLLPALGQPGEGLTMIIGEDTTTATVSFSRGFAGELTGLLDGFLSNQGPITSRETSLERDLNGLAETQDNLDRKMTLFQERLMNQFINMERIIGSLNSSGSFLENLIDTLPFTAKKD